MDTGQLTADERLVWEAYPLGRAVDFREGPERTVRAEVLRALLLEGPRQEGEVPVLRVAGARITGRLDLQYAEVDAAVHLWACVFDETPDLYGARLRQLNLGESVLPGFDATTLRVDGLLRMSGCRVRGPVRLAGARIAGAVLLDGAELGVVGAAGASEPILALHRATIEGDLGADAGFTAHGLVGIEGATVAGNISFDDAVLSNPGGTALHASTLSGGTNLRAQRLRAEGRVNLLGARIPGQVNFEDAHFSNPGGVALRASGVIAACLWMERAARVDGLVTLRGSQFELLHIAPETWPDHVRLDGLTYDRLGPNAPVERRLEVFERDTDGFVQHAYEQLTAAYRRVGDDAAARTVQLAKQRRHRAVLPPYARAWGYLQDVTVGYGFRPTRAAAWLLSLVLVGTVTFALRQPPALKPDESPEFNALAYTLDLLLPIVDFGQERAYAAAGAYQWFGYALVALGWTLATTIAAGVTRAISRQ
ncbi:membrane-associated oxidoreductase [Streptomyces venezuelae]|uniref:Membrane-associated oxidoreductase n=1 Tax=Streptomyces venezuelae TaxID=54571 RepID=A0A5P2C185_STRVZ|nr:membrane-associated oxidoreductase [Streptomyces venezuelae]QES36476.1 membrane-associated oxidoreductase [Streptomyces venezuelae]